MPDLTGLEVNLERFGDKLATLRGLAAKSLREVSVEVGVTASFLGILEKKKNPKTDRPSRPSKTLVFKLARALNATVEEAVELAGFAGYTLSEAEDHLAVARILADGRQPAVIQQLLDLETDLAAYVEQVRLVEAPIYTLLGFLDQIGEDAEPSVYITGRAFRARGVPASLYGRSDAVEARGEGLLEHKRPLKIAVLGQLMTPTVLLLRYLDLIRASYKVHNNDRPYASFSGGEEHNDEPIELVVVYSDDTQAEFLKYGYVDLALMVYPFRRVHTNEGQFAALALDLWEEYRDCDAPMNLVVTTPSAISTESRRDDLICRMDALRLAYKTLIGDRRNDGWNALVRDRKLDHEPTVLENFPELYLDSRDKDELARNLSELCTLGVELGLLQHKRTPDFYLPFVKTKKELFIGKGEGVQTTGYRT
jgi:transcriptional regulator with XRE-family HTH domain